MPVSLLYEKIYFFVPKIKISRTSMKFKKKKKKKFKVDIEWLLTETIGNRGRCMGELKRRYLFFILGTSHANFTRRYPVTFTRIKFKPDTSVNSIRQLWSFIFSYSP